MVARRAGIPLPTLSNYLQGRDMKAAALVRLAKACEVSIGWLASGEGTPEGAASDSDIPLCAPDLANKPANFWALFVPLRICQEYHQKMNLRPTLREVLIWISPLYRTARNTPDQPIEFK